MSSDLSRDQEIEAKIHIFTKVSFLLKFEDKGLNLDEACPNVWWVDDFLWEWNMQKNSPLLGFSDSEEWGFLNEVFNLS